MKNISCPLLRGHRMKKILYRMLDETEFLGDYGIRALSKYHEQHPYELHMDGDMLSVKYTPGESTNDLIRRKFQLAWTCMDAC